MSTSPRRDPYREGGGSYVIHASAARRRVKRLKIALRLAAAGIALLALALAWPEIDDQPPRAGAPAGSRGIDTGPLGSEDGYVAVGDSLSPFSDEPAVADLDSDLLDALRQAADDAGADGIELRVNGGWRSARYQEELLRRAIETYGSLDAARQYVKSPDDSSHVTGDAVDVGPPDAASWLSRHGNEYGLCQIYENEPWHFELATDPGGACPSMIANAAGG